MSSKSLSFAAAIFRGVDKEFNAVSESVIHQCSALMLFRLDGCVVTVEYLNAEDTSDGLSVIGEYGV